MIAIPVKTNSEQGVLAPLFGKAKYFALIDQQGSVTIQHNSMDGGVRVAHWLKGLGVNALITNHLGEKPFHTLLKEGIKIYFAGTERLYVDEVLARFKENALEEVSLLNYMQLLGEGHEEASHEDHAHTHAHSHATTERCCESSQPKKAQHEGCGCGHKHQRKGACHSSH